MRPRNRLYDCILAIHKAGLDTTSWYPVLEHFAAYVQQGKAAITTRDNDTGHVYVDDFVLTMTHNISQENVDTYLRYAHQLEKWTPIERTYDIGQVCLFSKHLPFTKPQKTPFYKQWLHHQHITDGIAIPIFTSKKYRIVFNVFFDDQTRSVQTLLDDLTSVSPHLQLATITRTMLSGHTLLAPSQRLTHWVTQEKGLTKREIDIGVGLVRFRIHKAIAEHLSVEVSIIKTHSNNISKKFYLGML